jgi:hypothetical protein
MCCFRHGDKSTRVSLREREMCLTSGTHNKNLKGKIRRKALQVDHEEINENILYNKKITEMIFQF